MEASRTMPSLFSSKGSKSLRKRLQLETGNAPGIDINHDFVKEAVRQFVAFAIRPVLPRTVEAFHHDGAFLHLEIHPRNVLRAVLPTQDLAFILVA